MLVSFLINYKTRPFIALILGNLYDNNDKWVYSYLFYSVYLIIIYIVFDAIISVK